MRSRIKELRYVPASDLRANPRNFRRHPTRQRQIMAKALEDLGYADALIARETEGGGLELLDGHLRAEITGEQEVPVLVLDVDEEEGRKILASLDPLAALAETNNDALQELLGQIDEEWVDKLHPRRSPNLPSDIDELAKPKRPRAKAGDLWLLGEHRILVGDATSRVDWRTLMAAGLAPAMVFTDPPYGVDYLEGAVTGDDKKRDELSKMLTSALKLATAHAIHDAAFYIWHAAGTDEDFLFALKAAGLIPLQQIIWVKPSHTLGRSHYQWAHEPCIYAARAGGSPNFYGDRAEPTTWRVAPASADRTVTIGPGLVLSDSKGGELYVAARAPKRKLRHIRVDKTVALQGPAPASSVWEVDRDPKAGHPTQKPVELATRALQNSSRTGELVVDPFLGSGSTLLGAEATGRICYGIELEPKWADVAVERWQRLTGLKATRG